ncbi:hypothetical protein DSECCO2_432130 [anaerobic digester metagenome]
MLKKIYNNVYSDKTLFFKFNKSKVPDNPLKYVLKVKYILKSEIKLKNRIPLKSGIE